MFGEIADSSAIRSTRLGEIRGGQDIRNAASLQQELLQFCSASTPILLKCSEIDNIDASTIQLFLAAKQEMRDLLHIEAQQTCEFRSWLKIAGADSILTTAE